MLCKGMVRDGVGVGGTSGPFFATGAPLRTVYISFVMRVWGMDARFLARGIWDGSDLDSSSRNNIYRTSPSNLNPSPPYFSTLRTSNSSRKLESEIYPLSFDSQRLAQPSSAQHSTAQRSPKFSPLLSSSIYPYRQSTHQSKSQFNHNLNTTRNRKAQSSVPRMASLLHIH